MNLIRFKICENIQTRFVQFRDQKERVKKVSKN